MKYIIVTKKKWDLKNFSKLDKKFIILKKLNKKLLNDINPKIIFFIHWSELIKYSLYNKYLCIQFHASDLPKGKGGSPIQNQILLNTKRTKLSAFKVSKKLDSGPVCLQNKLELNGTAHEIFKRMEKISILMIKKIVKIKEIKFYEQKGVSTFFKRRTPKQSQINLKKITSMNQLYNFMRMLDAPGYPNSFVKLNKFKFIFNDIRSYKNKISANIEIFKNEKK